MSGQFLPPIDLMYPSSPAIGVDKRKITLPGMALIRSTHGIQRVMLLIGLVLVVFFVVLAVLAPLIAPYKFGAIFTPQMPPSAMHWFGTTVGGFDVFSRVIYGARTAIEVILLAVALSIIVGVTLGVISGFIGTWLDRVLVLFMDALYSFPSLLLAIVVSIMVASGRSGPYVGILSAAVSITVVFIPQYFRVTRNATMQAKVEPYVDAARVAGAKPGRIMFGHILPNVSQSIPVLMTLNASEAILTLAALGFLGFGVEPNSAAEWGYDLNKARSDLVNGIWWTAIFPGLAIVLIVLGVTLIGESLNDVLNPLLRTRGGTTTADEAEVASVVGGAPEISTSSCAAQSGVAGPSPGASTETDPATSRRMTGLDAAERSPEVTPPDPSSTTPKDGGRS
ncbi:MAG: ABC transporter permease [Propionibacteriaceae bacterium]|nr:ABC transporter permease [Propionibacteriaceae bacterium]